MSTQLQLRRGTTAQHSTFTGASGEITIDTDKKTVVVHDGTTAGGMPVLPKTITDGTANGVIYLNSSKQVTSGSGLVFDGTNLGIGTSSPQSYGGNYAGLTLNGTVGGFVELRNNGTNVFEVNVNSSTTNLISYNKPYVFYGGASGATEQMRLDSSGNLGIGVTPSAWESGGKLQVGAGQTIGSTGNGLVLASNWYYNTGSKFAGTGYASYYIQQSGVHYWSTSTASGTAGNPASMSQAMTLDASGNLTISGSTATKASGTTWANPSDQRLKDNIRDYEKGLVELMQVRVREWEYNGKGGTTDGLKGLGVVADEIETILPNTVETYEAKLEETDEEVTTIKKFDATEITWLLVNAVKELTQRIEALEYTKQGE